MFNEMPIPDRPERYGPTMRIEVCGDLYQDREDMMIFANSMQMYRAITESLDIIRSRLKYENDYTEQEEKTLERIREELTKCGIEL